MEHDQRHPDDRPRERAAKLSWLPQVARDDVVINYIANHFVRGDLSYDLCLQQMIVAMAQRHQSLTAELIRAQECAPGPVVRIVPGSEITE